VVGVSACCRPSRPGTSGAIRREERRYRVAARGKNTADSSAGNLGFRIAADDY
jgi:hypothetical protein